MQAGLLTERIDILKNIVECNDFGEETANWVKKYSTRAKLINKSAVRTLPNGEVFYDSYKILDVRDYVDISYFDRIEWNNMIYRIVDYVPDKKNRSITLTIELVND